MSTSSRGAARERQVRKQLESEGWAVTRGAGSHGCADLWAAKRVQVACGYWRAGESMKHTTTPSTALRLIQVKADRDSPWANFRPSERAELLALAAQTGGTPELCWWPPHGLCHWLAESEWPEAKVAA